MTDSCSVNFSIRWVLRCRHYISEYLIVIDACSKESDWSCRSLLRLVNIGIEDACQSDWFRLYWVVQAHFRPMHSSRRYGRRVCRYYVNIVFRVSIRDSFPFRLFLLFVIQTLVYIYWYDFTALLLDINHNRLDRLLSLSLWRDDLELIIWHLRLLLRSIVGGTQSQTLSLLL